MVRGALAIVLGVAVLEPGHATRLGAQEILPPAAPPPLHAGLPPVPKGNSTVVGGQIRAVDPVRDQLTLKVFGGGSVKILYDERTQVFRDATPLSVLDLQPDDHASIETALDGTTVFALRIHLMKQVPEGEARGRVVSFEAATLRIEGTHETLAFKLEANTPIVRVGPMAAASAQGSVADLAPGSVVDVSFRNGKGSVASATRIDVVAVVGATFVFTGRVSTLDLQAGRLVLAGARDDETQVVSFDPARFPASRDLKTGAIVKATTTFDGTKYVASAIAVQ